jgi:flagellar protein FlgJ
MNEISAMNQNRTENSGSTPVSQDADKKAVEEKNKRLKKACADFESILIYNMLKTMRNTIPQSGLLKSYPGKDTHNMLIDQQIAADMAQSRNGLGLQKILFDQMTKSMKDKPVR